MNTMKQPGTELIPRSFFTHEAIKETMQSADLTLIFNRHATAGDAEHSTAVIEPGSAVFIEGFSATPGVNADIHFMLKGLSAALCLYGSESNTYLELKQTTLTHINTYAFEPARKYSDFHVNQCREIALLLEKDCYVAFADYDQDGIRGENATQREERNEAFYEHQQASSQNHLLNYGSTSHNLAKTIRSIQKAERSEYIKHFQREHFAVNSYYDNLLFINQSDKGRELAHTPSGKLKTYVIYGTAHARSLTERFKEWGATPQPHITHPLHESEYIPARPDAYVDNFHRHIALGAFRSLALSAGVDHETFKAFQDPLYDSLEDLNGNSQDYIRILCELLETVKLSETNPDLANLRLNNTYGRIVEGNI